MRHIKRIVEITQEFLEIPSAISFEQPFLKYLNKRAKKLGFKTNLHEQYLHIRPKKNEHTKKLFSMHIDRHSLIKNEEGELEYLAFYLKKKSSSRFSFEEIESIEREVVEKINQIDNLKCQLRDNFFIIKEEDNKTLKMERSGRKIFFESVGLRHTHENIKSYSPRSGRIKREYKTCRYDISIKDKKVKFDTTKPLKRGDEIFMLSNDVYFDKKVISGQIDNVISAAVIFYIMELGEFNQEALFTTKEEIGESYKSIKEFYDGHIFNKENTEQTTNLSLVILDTSPYLSLDEKERGFLTLRNGDERGIFDEKLGKKIKQITKEKKIPYHLKSPDTGKTELGTVIKETKGKINGTTIQLPTTNYHTTYETCTKESLKNYYRVIRELSKK